MAWRSKAIEESVNYYSQCLVITWVSAEANGRGVEEMVVVAAEHYGHPEYVNDPEFVAAVARGVELGPWTDIPNRFN